MNNRYGKNKEILKYAANFYEISNTSFKKSDTISIKMLQIYEEFIFGINIANKEEIEMCKSIDKIMHRYIVDFDFRKEVKDNLLNIKIRKKEDNVLRVVIKAIIDMHDKYLDEYTKRIYIPKWI